MESHSATAMTDEEILVWEVEAYLAYVEDCVILGIAHLMSMTW